MSCLFDSISVFLKKPSFEIRQIICNYLEQNHPIHPELETKVILELEDKDYIQKMRHPACWGGSNEIAAACNIWKLKIIVFIDKDHTKKIEHLPLDGIFQDIIAVEWQGEHYEPVKMFLF